MLLLISMSKNLSGTNLPPVGGYPSRKEWQKACWRKLLKASDFLGVLVTSNERRNLVMRAAVMDRLDSGKSYKQIVEELRLSPQTVSSIRKAASGNGYRSYRERGKTERKNRKYDSAPLIPKKPKPRGRPVRTKYGTIYLPD